MARPKGSAKIGGRQKGTPNKATYNAQEIAERLGIHPFEVICHTVAGNWKALGYKTESVEQCTPDGGILLKDRITLDMRLKAAIEACKYLHTQLKAVEVKNSAEDAGFKVIIEDYNSSEK
jgi:hypothetical protein